MVKMRRRKVRLHLHSPIEAGQSLRIAPRIVVRAAFLEKLLSLVVWHRVVGSATHASRLTSMSHASTGSS